MGNKYYPEAIKHYPIPMQLFVKKVVHRTEKKNSLVCIVGGTGSGKSYILLSLFICMRLYRFGKMPTVEEVIGDLFFKAKNVMKKLNDPELKKRGMIGWDEAGVDISHKTHATSQNKVIGWLVQTFRNLQQVVIFTVPTMSFIDASVRKLLHYQVETVRINYGDKMAICKPKVLQYNVSMDKTYYHPMYYQHKGQVFKTRFMGVPKPPEEYCDAYEKVKSEFTQDLNLRIQQELEKIDAKDKPLLTERQEAIVKLLEEGIVSTGEIAKKLETKSSSISDSFNALRKKGVNVDKYLGKSKISVD